VSVAAFAPGRVNLIGDHTDYAGGWVLPMAVQLGTTVTADRGGHRVVLESDAEPDPVSVGLDGSCRGQPAWARYVAGVVRQLRPVVGAAGHVKTTLPVGAGLSSSASLELAVALALGFEGVPVELARLGQRAEQEAAGVRCGIMDQLASAAGREGHAVLIDCRSEEFRHVPLPDGVEVRAVPSGETRRLAVSGYSSRRAECEAARRLAGPLRDASLQALSSIDDPVLLRRARHVITENARVLDFARCLSYGDLTGAGALMRESHESLRHDFEVSTPALDELVEHLGRRPGVFGARLTGAGFGGCAVAMARPGAISEGWTLRPSDGARLL
jgi:galactokinase